ncbi:MAG: hypothetical protein JO199_05590 [Candidatus Eremiobacteraeota bacterium]|nr:hypothetical protein [Candidatus Eremiobacteraeota bacterium]
MKIWGLFCLTAFALCSIAATPSPAPSPTPLVRVTSGDLITVRLVGGDIGSRISNEGDTFAVVTAEDYYFHGSLILPKGSPGYGEITHIKRAGMWHAGGEIRFTVKRLVAPDGSTLDVETNGATADADKNSEKNGNEFGQYLLFGLAGVFTHRGNDILIKDGTMFHVAVSNTTEVPAIAYGTKPESLDWNLVTVKSKEQVDEQGSAPASPAPEASPTSSPRPATK